MLQGVENLGEEIKRLPPAEMPLLIDILLERDAVEILHDDIIQIVVERNVKHLDDVFMIQNGDGARLVFKAHAKLLVGQEFLLEHLDGNGCAGLHVDGTVDDGHAAHPDDTLDAIAAVDQLSNQSVHLVPPYRDISTAVTLSLAPASREASMRASTALAASGFCSRAQICCSSSMLLSPSEHSSSLSPGTRATLK